VLYLLDCAAEMMVPEDDPDEDEPMSPCLKALHCILKMMKLKIISQPNDSIGLVCFNSRENVNENDFKGVHVFMDLGETTAARIKQIESLKDPDTFESLIGSAPASTCELYTALWTCSSIFSNANIKDSCQRVFFITNQDSPDGNDLTLRDKAAMKVEDMKDLGIDVHFFPLQRNGGFDVNIYFKHVLLMPEDSSNRKEDLFRSFSTMDDMADGMRKKNVKKRSLASVALEITGDIKLGVKMYVLCREASKERGGWLERSTNEPLTTVTQWICKDTGHILESYQIRKYFNYGDTKVFFEPSEMKDIKTFGQPGLTLMGFKKQSYLKPHHNLRSSYFLFPDETSFKGSTVSFVALVNQMHRMKRMAVARMVYRKSSGVKFVALLPQIETQDEDGTIKDPCGMHLVFLPYADDIRKLTVPRTQCAEPDLIKKAKVVVKALSINFTGQTICNPSLQKHYNVLQALALDEEDAEEHDDELEPDWDGIKKFETVLEDFRSAAFDVAFEEDEEDDGGGGGSGGARKRKGDEGGSGASKKQRTKGDYTDYDWEGMARESTLCRITIPELKVYLRQHGLPMSGAKAILVERVEQHLVDALGNGSQD